MKIFSAVQLRLADEYTIRHEPLPSVQLMERACRVFAEWFVKKFTDKSLKIKVFCGTGNNGGDGLGIARLLTEKGYTVKIYILQTTAHPSPDFEANKARAVVTKVIKIPSDLPRLTETDILIDAIFGTGLNKHIIDPTVIHVIDEINKTGLPVVSVDIASGLYADRHTESAHIIEPLHTLSFQLPKLAFLLPENQKYTGTWHLADIGLHPAFIEQTATPYYFTDEAAIQKMFRKRGLFAHKGTFGHALLIAGSYGKMGAAVLSAQACLRTGVGLLTVQVPAAGYVILQSSVPEAMTITDEEKEVISQLIDIEKFTTLGIGPGLGTHIKTVEMLESLVRNLKKPIVIDADALNILSQRKSLLHLLPENCIFTPHLKEFERLTGTTFRNDFERLEALQQFAIQNKVIVVLKGHFTAVALPTGEVHFNSTGNPGMATGGSGDVLTGMITALLAQGYLPHEAAMLGVYLHGKAGDLAAGTQGFAGMIASDIVACIPKAMQAFES